MPDTAQLVIDLVNAGLDDAAVSSGPGRFTETEILRWIGSAYKRMNDLLRIPLATSSSTTSVSGTRSYDLPSDCWKGIDGLVSVEYGSLPLVRNYREQLQQEFGEDWLAPGADEVTWFLTYDNPAKFTLVPAPGATGTVIKLIYVQRLTAPATAATNLPTGFVDYVDIIADYVLGQALNRDKEGRGAAKIAEFEGRLLRTHRLSERKRGRRTMPEAYTQGFRNYRSGYGRRGRTR